MSHKKMSAGISVNSPGNIDIPTRWEDNAVTNMETTNSNELATIAHIMREQIIELLFRIGLDHKGHPGGALSMTDIVTCLYFDVMKIDPANPNWPDRDRFILSKGHACPAVYAALALRGFFDKSHLYSLRHVGSLLQGHPDMVKTPGIDMTTGSLGHGPSAGIGMALAAKLDKKTYQTYVLAGDGEMQEGLIWEALMTAGGYKLNNLTLIIDRNRWQGCASIEQTLDIEPLASKLSAFRWEVLEIDGHNIAQILDALKRPRNEQPRAIIAHTIKGKGISFMEGNNSWHQRPITPEEYKQAMDELKAIRLKNGFEIN